MPGTKKWAGDSKKINSNFFFSSASHNYNVCMLIKNWELARVNGSCSIYFFFLYIFFLLHICKNMLVWMISSCTNVHQVMAFFLLHVSRDHYCCCYLFYFIFCWWCVTTLEMYAYVLFPMFAYIDLYHFDIEIHKYERKMEDYGTSNFFYRCC